MFRRDQLLKTFSTWTAILKSEGARIDIFLCMHQILSCHAWSVRAECPACRVDVGASKPPYLAPRRYSTTTVYCLGLVPYIGKKYITQKCIAAKIFFSLKVQVSPRTADDDQQAAAILVVEWISSHSLCPVLVLACCAVADWVNDAGIFVLLWDVVLSIQYCTVMHVAKWRGRVGVKLLLDQAKYMYVSWPA